MSRRIRPSPLAASPVATPEALLNSRSGRIHLFPAVASSAEVAFRHFQARGGFLVSAAKNADGVYYVEIQPRRNNRCSLMNPWPGQRGGRARGRKDRPRSGRGRSPERRVLESLRRSPIINTSLNPNDTTL